MSPKSKQIKTSTFVSKFGEEMRKFWESLSPCIHIFKCQNLNKKLFMKTISKYVISFYLLKVW